MDTLIIGIYDRSIRFLELNAQREITFVQSVDTPFSFTECFKLGNYDESLISEACSIIKDSFKNKNFSSLKVFLLLDTNYSFLNIIPIDFNENETNITSSIIWDISNYYPDNYKNFKINYYKLNDYKFAPGIKATLIIAIDNSVLEIIRKIFHNCRIQISLFDLDHFAADKYATDIFVDSTYNSEIITIGCKRNRIDLSITGQKGLRHFDFIYFKDSNYQSKLLKLISNIKREIFLKQIKLAMVYGEDYAGDACKFLSNRFNYIEFKMPNPFDVFSFSEKRQLERKIKAEGNKFLPLFGLLLKGK